MPFSIKLINILSRRWVVYIGLIITVVAHALMGLDPGSAMAHALMGLDPGSDISTGATGKIGFNILGMSIFCWGLGFILIPLLPEILDAAEKNAKAKGIDYNEK